MIPAAVETLSWWGFFSNTNASLVAGEDSKMGSVLRSNYDEKIGHRYIFGSRLVVAAMVLAAGLVSSSAILAWSYTTHSDSQGASYLILFKKADVDDRFEGGYRGKLLLN